MGNDSADGGLQNRAEQVNKGLKSVIEIVTSMVAIGSAIAAFTTRVGGLQQFLIEVSFFGFAIYISLFVVGIPAVLGLEILESRTRRDTTDAGWAVALTLVAIGGGAFVRFKLFDQSVSQDLDGVGTAFGVIVGFVILLLPLLVLWYIVGSRPSSDG